jgi:hypothetical protein
MESRVSEIPYISKMSPLQQKPLELDIKRCRSWAWWAILVISVLGRLRQEEHEFKASWAI